MSEGSEGKQTPRGHDGPAESGESAAPAPGGSGVPGFSGPNITETGAAVDGVPVTLDERAYYQLHVFTGAGDTREIVAAVRESKLNAVVYADVNDPRGVGILIISEDPALFVGKARNLLAGPPFDRLERLEEFTGQAV